MEELLAAEGRGSWIPEGTAGKVVILLMFAFIVGAFAYGIWNKNRRRGQR